MERLNNDLNGDTPLMISIKEKNYSQFNQLIESGVDVNLTNNDRQTAAFLAINDYDMLVPLIQNGADLNVVNKYTILILIKQI